MSSVGSFFSYINPLNAELNPTCRLLALFGAHHILHVSRIRVNDARSHEPEEYFFVFSVKFAASCIWISELGKSSSYESYVFAIICGILRDLTRNLPISFYGILIHFNYGVFGLQVTALNHRSSAHSYQFYWGVPWINIPLLFMLHGYVRMNLSTQRTYK